jgi:TPR repeat protein
LAYTDPWRIVEGKTNHVSAAEGWKRFYGHVLAVTKQGILMTNEHDSKVWFIAEFPYTVADGDYLSPLKNFAAWPDGVFQYKNAAGESKTAHKMEYGKRLQAPGDLAAADAEKQKRQADELREQATRMRESARKLAAEKKRNADDAAFKFHSEQAAAGRVGSMLRLGQFYLEGTGCAANTNLAKQWLKRAADAGNAEAAATLRSLE